VSSTKIINVLKEDKFEEILDLFKETPAQEVIFVLPKKSKFLTNEKHFEILADESAENKKKVSILCSNPDINKMAKDYKFDVLLPKKASKTSFVTEKEFAEPTMEAPELVDNLKFEEDFENKNLNVETVLEKDEEERDIVNLTVSTRTRGGLEGIITKKPGTRLNILTKKDKPVELNIEKLPHKSTADIQEVWDTLPSNEDDDKNIWAGYKVPWLSKTQQENSSKIKPGRNLDQKSKDGFLPQFKSGVFSKKLAVTMGAASVVLLGIIIFVSTGSAKIEIIPKKQPIDTELKVNSSDKFSSIDQNLKNIPGQFFSISKTVNQTFTATGEREVAQKARGKMKIFNAYGTAPQVLIATTRFEKEGLIFRTLTNVTVPGTKVENGKITPGVVEVEVVADKAGENYNISSGKFTIPAFKERADTGRYEKIYGETIETMKGGIIGRAKVVTEDDFNKAEETLQTQLQKEIDESLKLQTIGLKTINSLSIKTDKPESSAGIDEAAESFTVSLKGSLKTIAFKQSDLDELIKQHVEKTQNLDVVSDKLDLNYKSANLNEVENLLEFTITMSGVVFAKIDTDKIRLDLKEKDEDEIKAYFRNVAEVESAKVALFPFWVKRIPKNQEEILIKVFYQ